ncbi:nickel-dependent hydrogenase large subunit [Sulfurimonas sp.]|uniref:nickel-dependent hydrogenase large subunit n=1 Tax=Sulfurimonas sp. TaxID=2022749 RepID=UPI002B49378F|nr:nickel-dependent hydrogenase large subunit [Sulfurimonas sp.]
MIKLIEKIEGEAKLNFNFKEKKIDFVDIEFMSTRSIEKMLEGKSALDALVINPRVCGICGHAHLIATVKAIEDCYDDLKISKKAEILRELTLNFELIQNHFKWFYLTMRPLFGEKQELFKATFPAQLMSKAIAVFGGQYPHTSYAIVGGVVCEITEMDIIKITHYLDETIKFFKDNVVDGDGENLLTCRNIDKVLNKKGDLADILKEIKKREWINLGKSYDRFIVFGQNSYFNSGKSVKTRLIQNLSYSYVKEEQNNNSFAKNVSYKGKYFEVGPLARAMVNKIPLIKDAHRKYGDSIFTRILARVCETAHLLAHSKKLLDELDLSEPSFIKPSVDISKIDGVGQASVEAARGSLVHKVELEKGIIKNYEIITPTQWNLSGGTKENQGVSQKAMIGLSDVKVAELVFKTFDVCSVCTTH